MKHAMELDGPEVDEMDKSELRDEVVSDSLDNLKNKKIIKDILHSKFGGFNSQILGNDIKQNPISDMVKVPHIKNRLYSSVGETQETLSVCEKLDSSKYFNAINEPTSVLLLALKQKYQKDKDLLEASTRGESNREGYNIDIQQDDRIQVKDYEYMGYFVHKYEVFENVQISESKPKEIINSIIDDSQTQKNLIIDIFRRLQSQKILPRKSVLKSNVNS